MEDLSHLIMFILIAYTTVFGYLTYAIMLLLILVYMQLVVIERKLNK